MTAIPLLGRTPTDPADLARTFKLGDYMPIPAAPATLDATAGIQSWPMFANDTHQDCTAAGAAHLVMVWSTQVHVPVPITDVDVLALYAMYNGGVDNGGTMIDALNAWRAKPFTGRPEGGVKAYVAVDVKNLDHIRSAAWLFSGLYIALDLPLTARGQAVWDYTTLPDGTATTAANPGTWGGHCVVVVGYTAIGPLVVTWGTLKQMTWAFWSHYAVEAYAVMPLAYDDLGANLLANGFNASLLEADLEKLGT
jgi:hypothetical protein